MKEAGIDGKSIRSLDDLDKLPFTTKSDLRDNYPFGLVAVPMKEIVRIHASSGTTGKPTVVAYTQTDVEMWSELMARTYAASCDPRFFGLTALCCDVALQRNQFGQIGARQNSG